jgi:hypothetical protein
MIFGDLEEDGFFMLVPTQWKRKEALPTRPHLPQAGGEEKERMDCGRYWRGAGEEIYNPV